MIEYLIVFVTLISAFPWAIYLYLTRNYDYWKKKGVNGPKPQLLVGNFPSLLNGKHHIIYDFDNIYSEYKKKERAVGVFMTRNPELLILDPKLANEIMVSNFRSFRENGASKWIPSEKKDKFATRNPFFSNVDLWKTRRAEALGGVTVNKLTSAYPIWQGVAKKLKYYLKEKAQDKSAEIETKDLAQRFTSAIVADFLWGVDSKSFSTNPEDLNPILDLGRRMLVGSFGAVTLYFQLSVVPFLRKLFTITFYPKETDEFFSMLMEDAIKLRLKQKNQDRVDYLNYCIQLKEKKGLSHDDLMGHSLTVFLDGYETAANILYHTLFYLAKNHHLQEKLRSEILDSLGPRQFLSFDELNGLPFLNQCVHETIRIVSPIPFFSRVCTDKTEIQLKGDKTLTITPGEVMTIPVFSYHHDPQYFPDPYKYKPERFDHESISDLTKQGIFMPFGDGPRICLGMRMGLLEVKTGLVEILKSYRVNPCPKTIEEQRPNAESFILGLEGDIWLEYEKL